MCYAQIRRNVHFPSTEAADGIGELVCSLPRKRRPRSVSGGEKISMRPVRRATRGSLSLSLFLSRVYDLAHFVPHSGHTYAVASRTSSKFTARERAAGTDARLGPRRAGAAPLLCIVVARTSSRLRNHPSPPPQTEREIGVRTARP